MQLRAAVRYSEYRNAKKLPSNAKFNCKECIKKGWQERRNCNGEKTNEKYKVQIGNMVFDQCPVSVPSKEAWDVIELITTAEQTGIPVVGTCLLDHTKKYFEFRRIINSEQAECFDEIQKIRDSEIKKQQMREKLMNKTMPVKGVRGKNL